VHGGVRQNLAVTTPPARGSSRTFAVPFPLDLGLTLGPLRHGAGDPTIRFARDGVWRATRTAQGAATTRLVLDRGSLSATAWGPGAEAALEGIPALVGFDDDPAAFRPALPLLADLHRRLAGLRVGRTGAIFEALLPAIIEQKVVAEEARRSYRALIRNHGEPAPGPADLRLAPAPATLAALPYFAFHPLGMERRRADTIRRAATRAARLEEAASMRSEAAMTRLTAIPGIGPWTAAEALRAALGDPDLVSVGDYHLPNVVAWALAGEPRGDDARMLELLEPYRGQRGRVVRLLEAGGIGAPRFGPKMPIRSIASQ
jgi:3-methyladenine DNA glycosylase/8-oxoguanine DNA glycosylase